MLFAAGACLRFHGAVLPGSHRPCTAGHIHGMNNALIHVYS